MNLRKRAESVWEYLRDQVMLYQQLGSEKNKKQGIEAIESELQKVREECEIELASRQALFHCESLIINGKIVANKEMYKQPVDWYKEGKRDGRKEALEEAASAIEGLECIDEEHRICAAEHIRALAEEKK